MDSLKKIHKDSIYYDFMLIEKRAYREKIKFFEKNKNTIFELAVLQGVEIWYYYTQATFEIGDYKKYVDLSVPLIEKVIEENIERYGDTNVYESLLFNKAVSHLHLKQYRKAEYIFKELIKIDKSNKLYVKAFMHNRFLERIKDTMAIKLFTVIMLFTIISISLLETLIIAPFYPNIETSIELLRDLLIISMFSVILLNSAYHYFTAKRTVRQMILRKKTYL